MSVIIDLDGPREPPADTIRKLIYDAWLEKYPADTDIIIATENGSNASNSPLTANDLKLIQTANTAYVRIHDVASRIITQSNYMSYFAYDVYVDIFSMSAPAISTTDATDRALMIRDVIDDIVMRRKIGPYYKASDGLNSGMTDIANRAIEWQRMSGSNYVDDKDIKTESYHGITER